MILYLKTKTYIEKNPAFQIVWRKQDIYLKESGTKFKSVTPYKNQFTVDQGPYQNRGKTLRGIGKNSPRRTLEAQELTNGITLNYKHF